MMGGGASPILSIPEARCNVKLHLEVRQCTQSHSLSMKLAIWIEIPQNFTHLHITAFARRCGNVHAHVCMLVHACAGRRTTGIHSSQDGTSLTCFWSALHIQHMNPEGPCLLVPVYCMSRCVNRSVVCAQGVVELQAQQKMPKCTFEKTKSKAQELLTGELRRGSGICYCPKFGIVAILPTRNYPQMKSAHLL